MNAQNTIIGFTQNPKEQVVDYTARLQVAAAAKYPTPPVELKVVVVEGKSFIMPNPVKGDEKAEYNALVRLAETTILRHFLVGLRPEIQDRLPTAKYEMLEQAVEAAKDSEWMKGSMATGILHHLQSPSPGEECHALRTEVGRDSGPQCFGCKEFGHIRRNCPAVTQYQSRSKGTGNRFRARPLRTTGFGVSAREDPLRATGFGVSSREGRVPLAT
jgi:hypothetical protein